MDYLGEGSWDEGGGALRELVQLGDNLGCELCMTKVLVNRLKLVVGKASREIRGISFPWMILEGDLSTGASLGKRTVGVHYIMRESALSSL